MVFIKSSNIFFCSSDRVLHFVNSALCSSVNELSVSPTEKNCTSVIPNAPHIASNVENVGALFRLNILVIVDCANHDSFASRYSVQPRSSISTLILFCIFIIYHLPFCNYYTSQKGGIIVIIGRHNITQKGYIAGYIVAAIRVYYF